ncbi:ADP-ribosylglycohydrolase family protein [Thermasporomyces composti]|jgi:ADP-ribosylglycohydrolase|uniref:ADP-ribosylglycohydrolase n=1 Tax=Thermasporomyces composti TaxID=696763 RepID=A0A3D9VJF5_THECX|nr:ADP-ribosylglycohydrolase family protein [Thermasporomyces composti]REF37471.1 ADP-ribosylglycohydrolase [Thermasporomyces composti]
MEPSDLPAVLDDELRQRREAGYDVSPVLDQLDRPPREVSPTRARALLDQLERLPRRPDWPYVEPSDREGIEAELPPASPPARPIGNAELRDRIEAAWLGRCAGNCLGKPVENGAFWTPERLRHYLELSGNYPIRDYIRRLDPMPEGFELNPCWTETTKGRVVAAPRDDDLDYTLLGLHLLETRGFDYTCADVAEEWLLRLPYHLTYTAERVTYRNLVNGVEPERAAVVDNPYREWIGAQIRGDVFGYVCAGRPRDAALLAYQDAVLSHRGNGIYGEMWAAALVAAAFTATTLRDAVEESLRHVPARSRLAEALRWAVEVYDSKVTWEEARARLDERYGHYHWVHTINNAVACVFGLLYAEDDYTNAIGLTVQAGLDTDSNGGTVGSVAGAFAGRGGIPRHWTSPFSDTLRSGLFGFDHSSIRDLAERTFALARTYACQRAQPVSRLDRGDSTSSRS